MNLEVLAWAATKAAFRAAIVSTPPPGRTEPFASYLRNMDGTLASPRVLVPGPGLNIDEVGEIVGTPAVPDPGDPTGPPLVPAVMVPGWHVNLRFHEPLADALVEGLPQTDEEGKPLPLFERTHLLTWFPQAVWDATGSPVPPGYVGPKNLRLFDPATVTNRSRIWA